MTMQRSASIDQRDLFDHAEFVRAVARRLLDEHRAEDVVQETMLVAHQRRASLRHDARGWLATVARNFARMSLRGEARRVARESVPPETTPIDTPDAVAARLETQRQVVDAVRSLPEKYRIVVTLRFFEGLSPVQIARRQGVPVKTVHTRLRRAFERLRDQLQGEHGEDHRAWALALVPLASLPSVRGYSTATSVGCGVWPVLQIPVLFLTIAAAFVFVGEKLTSASVSRTHRTDGASTRVHATASRSRESPETLADPRPLRGGASSGTTLVHGTIAYSVAGARGSAWVSVRRVSNLDLPTGDPVAAESARDGSFSLDVTRLVADAAVSSLELRVDHPRHLVARRRILVARDRPTPRIELVTLELRAAAVVQGVFLDPDGYPLSGAAVGLFRDEGGAPIPPAVESGRTGPDGRYRLRAPAGGRHLVLAAADGLGPAHVRTALRPGAVTHARSLRARRTVALRGTLMVNGELTRLGSIELGRVEVEAVAEKSTAEPLPSLGLSWSRGGAWRSRASAVVSPDDGSFCIDGLETGRFAIRVFRLGEGHPDLADAPGVTVRAPSNGVRLDVAVCFVDVILRPASGGTVRATGHAVMKCPVNAEGRGRLALVPGQRYTLQSVQPGFETASRVVTTPAAGEAVTIVLDRARRSAQSTLRVRFRGRELANAGFALFRPGAAAPSVRRSVRGNDGVFELSALPPGAWRIEALPGAAYYHPLSYYLRAQKQVDLRAGATESIELEVRAGGRLRVMPRTTRGEPARCRCEVFDSSGHRVRVSFYVSASGGWTRSDSWIGPSTTEVGPALPPGRYRVRLFGAGLIERIVEVEIVGGKTAELAARVQRS